MERGTVTTPFGRRPMTFALLAGRHQQDLPPSGAKKNKWKLFRAVCEAREELGIGDRALTVLDALLSFHPGDDLDQADNLVVFPSNEQLCLRARGMAPATLRRHLGSLVDAGLLLRKDSPNGKRYARRNRSGKIDDAFGFSLTPLLQRAAEIQLIADRLIEARENLRRLKESVSLIRRDIGKLIILARLEGIAADWDDLEERYKSLVSDIPRKPTLINLLPRQAALGALKKEIVNILENQQKFQKLSSNAHQTEHHKQDSKTIIPFEYEAENRFSVSSIEQPQKIDAALSTKQAPPRSNASAQQSQPTPQRAIALETVVRACPSIADYTASGTVRNWSDVVAAGAVVRPMLNITAATWSKATSILGIQQASIVIACMLERAEHIRQPGAYLQDLVKRAEQHQFSLEPMLTTLLSARMKERSQLSEITRPMPAISLAKNLRSNARFEVPSVHDVGHRFAPRFPHSLQKIVGET